MVAPGKLDNRWIVMPRDFPSATMLLSRGMNEVIVITEGEGPARGDLAHVLLRWRRAWYRLIALAGFRRSNVGGFGAQIPEEYEDGGIGGFA